MKKLLSIFIAITFVSVATQLVAQENDSVQFTKPQVLNGETDQENDLRSEDQSGVKDEAVEHDTDKASQASRTMAAQLKDEKLESKEGPDGEPVFVNGDSSYYYIDKEGKKVIVDKSQLKVKK